MTQNNKTSPKALFRIVRSYLRAGNIEEALNVAETIADPFYHALALTYAGAALAREGEKDKAALVLENALKTSDLIEDRTARSKIMERAVFSLLLAERVERALEVSKEIEDNFFRVMAVKHILEASFDPKYKEEDGLREGALEVAQTVEDSHDRSRLLADIAAAFAGAGKPERARKIAEGIEREKFRFKAMTEVAVAFARAGNVENAWEVAMRIKWDFERYSTQRAIVMALLNRGDLEKARNVAMKMEYKLDRDLLLGEIARAFFEAGDHEKSIETVTMMGSNYHRSAALKSLCQMYVREGDFERALETAGRIAEGKFLYEALSSIVGAAVPMEREEANRTLAIALDIAESIGNAYWHSKTIAEISRAFFKMGDFKKAFELAKRVKKRSIRYELLRELAVTSAQRGMDDRAEEAARAIDDEFLRSKTMFEIVRALTSAGKLEKAAEVSKRIELQHWRTRAEEEIRRYRH